MKVECPNCKMVSAIKEDSIVTEHHVVDLSCPACDFAMALNLRFNLIQQDTTPPPVDFTDDQLTASDSAPGDAGAHRRIVALKAKILRGLVNLPPMPHIILKAREILSDPDSSLKDLAKVIETDQAMVAKVLTLANSAYYGVSGMVSSIQHASVLLGQKTLGQMITISASSALLNKKLLGYGIAPDEMWKHSLACAFAGKRIAEMCDGQLAEDAFIAGLLHDAGKIILDPYLTKHKQEFPPPDGQKEPAFFEVEKAILGFDHAEIMSRACRLWRFPELQVTAIRYHHQPSLSQEHKLAGIIHLADVLAKTAGFAAGLAGDRDQIVPGLLKHLQIQQQDLAGVVSAVAEDVQKIEAEMQG